LAPFI